ncbi:MAG TPA: hypothetical protein VK540_32540 [Polyangiaceae bacterium]|nr:hypothetical protein [Polyangiaceae bacterium]
MNFARAREHLAIVLALLVAVGGASSSCTHEAKPSGATLRIVVTFPPSLEPKSIDGRLVVVVATEESPEPRFRVTDNDDTAQIFGIDVEGWKPTVTAVVDGATLGYPVRSLAELRPGDYVVQALVHRYETFTRGDGHTVKLPPDRGEGQQWNRAPGDLLSAPRRVRIDRGTPEVRIDLDRAEPALLEVKDTKYVRHVRVESPRLTKFWGRPTFLGAIVILPEGWDSHEAAHYPLAIAHNHFTREFFGFRESPPDDGLPKVDLDALRVHCPNGHEGDFCDRHGYKRLEQELSHEFYKQWTGPGFPRALLVAIQHANPYYDDSYAVNSENLGPYGDAITYDLLPYLEKTFRGLGPWARGVYGGSTGGWEAMAAQVFYPDEYNGAIVNCPDPIDFRSYLTIDLYQDRNAYYAEGPFRRTARAGERDYLGRVRSTVEQQNLKELVLGTHSRSGGQWDIWEAVFSPVGSDGYPARIWDKASGAIDPRIAQSWREHYDIGHILRRDWAKLGPKLRGKLTINVGLSDNFFLNDAVYLVEDFLKTAEPPADASIDYGARDEHCWSGDHGTFNGVSRFTANARSLKKLADHWLRTAPPGADVTSWRY